MDIGVIDDASGDDLGGLGPVLSRGARLAAEIRVGVVVALAADHGAVVVLWVGKTIFVVDC